MDSGIQSQCDTVLRKLIKRADNRVGVVVHVGRSAADFGLRREDLYQAVLFCVEAGHLAYEGAGPRVSLTELGALRVRQLRASGTDVPPTNSAPR